MTKDEKSAYAKFLRTLPPAKFAREAYDVGLNECWAEERGTQQEYERSDAEAKLLRKEMDRRLKQEDAK